MKEDVLEQIVDDYLQLQGYFTIHNVRFKPALDHPEYISNKDSVPSDVDVVGFNPKLPPPRRVLVVSCKSWQTGFDAPRILAQLREEVPNPAHPQRLRFRELWIEKWALGFRDRIEALTGETSFIYCIAVTRLRGDTSGWTSDPTIRRCLGGNALEFLPLKRMWSSVLDQVTTTPASSEIGRLAQLLKAARLTDRKEVAPLAGPEPGSDAALAEIADTGELPDTEAGTDGLGSNGVLGGSSSGEDDELLAGVSVATVNQWEHLWSAVDRLLAEEEWVEWASPEPRPDGVIVMGWPKYSDAMTQTIEALDGVGAVSSAFDWPEWHRRWVSAGTSDLRACPPGDSIRYITSVIRGEHFADGALAAAMRDGSLPAALARLRSWYDNERLP